MRRIKTLISTGIILSLMLVSCGTEDASPVANASNEKSSFSLVSVDNINGQDIVTIKHKDTGCYFVYTSDYSKSTGNRTVGSPVPLPRPNSNGIPYCVK